MAFLDIFYEKIIQALKPAEMKKIEAVERWCYRRMLYISWMDDVTNDEALQTMNIQKETIITIKKRKLNILGINGRLKIWLLNLIKGKRKFKSKTDILDSQSQGAFGFYLESPL